MPNQQQYYAIRTLVTFVVVLVVRQAAHADDPADARPADRPNVILIMADDLGYGDIGCYGSEKIRTPVLDKMASEGVRLTSFYAGCTVCTPSRMALLTGAYPVRVGWRGGVIGYRIKPVNGLSPKALTMAEVFKSAGYATAICGKWHLGDAEPLLPVNQGFDSAYYIKKSNNQTKKLYHGAELIQNPFDNRRLTEQFIGEAIKFVQANRRQPFFLYIPLTAPHFPAEAHPDWKGRSQLGPYGDVVEELDSRIDHLLRVLKEEQLEKNTIVLFTSDNGPEPGQKKWARATPYRGLKWSSLEGGNRVPCIVRFPGVIPAGRVSSEITAAIDLLPTLAQACGIDLKARTKASPKIDGVDVWETLIGKRRVRHARTDLLFWQGWAMPQAIRVGEWKLYFDEVKGIASSDEGPVLIDLSKDPTEQTDLSDQHPEKVQAMKELALERIEDIEDHSLPLGGPGSRERAKIKLGKWLN